MIRKEWKAGVWFHLINSAFVFLIASKYIELLFDGAGQVHPLYSVAACFSHFLAISFLPFLLFFLPVCYFTKKERLVRWGSIVLAAVCLVILTIDAYVFYLYRFHIDSYVLEQVFGPSSGQVFEFTIGQYLLVVGVVLALLAMEYGIYRLASYVAERVSVRPLLWIGSAWLLALVTVQIYRTCGLFKSDRSIYAIERHFPLVAPVYPNWILGVGEGPVRLDVEGRKQNYPTKKLAEHPTGKNLLIIAFDSWRASAMDSLCTPHIYGFSKKSQTFHHHYSGSNGTRTGVFSLFYGLPGVSFQDFRSEHIQPVLLQELAAEGYDMRLFPSASLRNPPLDQNVFYALSDQCDPTEGMNAWQRDVNLSRNFIQYLTERDTTRPFFSFLFFDSLHSMIKPSDYKGPFQPSWENAQYEKLLFDVDPQEFLNLYKNMAYYLDSLVGRVLDELEAKGLLEETIVVITGDHAQEFNDNGRCFWGHNGNYSSAQMEVPMIYYKSGNAPADYSHWTSHYDVVPTLMKDLFGCENRVSDYSTGQLLTDETPRKALLVDSYIGAGVVEASGRITNIYYDGTYSIMDSSLKEDFTTEIDKKMVEELLKN